VRQITKGSFLALALLMASSAMATPLQGVFRFSGTAIVSATATNFTPNGDDANEGAVVFGQDLNTGDFAFLNGFPPTFGDVDDRDALTTPTDTDLNIPNYIEIYGDPGQRFRFTLRRILPGTFTDAQCGLPAANGQICTPELFGLVSPYNLNNFSEEGDISTQGSFTTIGDVEYLDLDGTTVLETGQFSATFVSNFKGQSFQELLAIVTAGGTVNAGFTATVTVTQAAIPEPSTLGLSGLALLGLAGAARRFRK
jgi:hypothetical protein